MADYAHPAPSYTMPKVLLFGGLALTSMGQSVLFAVLGPSARDTGLSEIQAGAVISVSAMTVVAVSPLWGRISDRRGRRPVFAFALAGFALSTLLFAYLLQNALAGAISGASAFAVLAGARVLYALGIAGGQPAAAGFIADISAPEDRARAMALIGGAFGIGAILGPSLAFATSGFGVLVPLYGVALIGVLWWLLVLARLPEPPALRARDTGVPALAMTDRRLRAVLLGTVLVFTSIAMVQQTVAFLVQDRFSLATQATAARTGAVFAVLAVFNLIAIIAVSRTQLGPSTLIRNGGLVAAAGVALLLPPLSAAGIFVAAGVMGAGFGAMVPGLQGKASLAVGKEVQGAAAGFVSAAMAGGFILGPVLGTGLYMVGSWATYGGAALVAFCGALLAARAV
ncbi:MAG: MFS transporter [Pseudomonadota bacterium]